MFFHFGRGFSNIVGSVFLKIQIVGMNCIDSAVARFAPHYKFDYDEDKLSSIQYFKNQEPSAEDYNGVSEIRFTYSENTETRFFYNVDGVKMKNENGVYGQGLEHMKGKLLVFNLNNHGDLMHDNEGVCVLEWELDHTGRRSSCTLYNMKGEQITDNEGNYILTFKYDGRGNLIEVANLNENLELSNDKSGIAYFRYMYDEMNNLVTALFYDKDHKSTSEKYGYAGWFGSFDLNGNTIRTHYQNADGSTHIYENGIAYSYYSYDDFGNVTEKKFYGTNKNLYIDKKGYGRIERKYDSLSRVTEETNFDAYDAYLNAKDNICRKHYRYNKKNQISEEDCFFIDTLIIPQHLKSIHYTYGDHENIIEESYYDIDGVLWADSIGICMKRFKYDSRNNLIEESYFNLENNFQPFSADAVKVRYRYDSNDYRTEIAFYNSKDKLTENKVGLSIDYYNNGAKWREIRYIDNDMQLKSEISFHMNGRVASKYINGKVVYWDEEGNKIILLPLPIFSMMAVIYILRSFLNINGYITGIFLKIQTPWQSRRVMMDTTGLSLRIRLVVMIHQRFLFMEIHCIRQLSVLKI
jgi:hypothetical protein